MEHSSNIYVYFIFFMNEVTTVDCKYNVVERFPNI